MGAGAAARAGLPGALSAPLLAAVSAPGPALSRATLIAAAAALLALAPTPVPVAAPAPRPGVAGVAPRAVGRY
ncbi:MAG TPA: hypothetical protein VGI44_19465 [Acidimicrobiales bacterium]